MHIAQGPFPGPSSSEPRVAGARSREEEPLAELLDFGVVYSLFVRPPARGAISSRLILKVSWEEHGTGEPGGNDSKTEGQSCAFEIDLARERLVALGRKNHSLPPERFCAARLCRWARETLAEAASAGNNRRRE